MNGVKNFSDSIHGPEDAFSIGLLQDRAMTWWRLCERDGYGRLLANHGGSLCPTVNVLADMMMMMIVPVHKVYTLI